MTQHVYLLVEDCDYVQSWITAESADAAISVIRKMYGDTFPENEWTIKQLPDNQELLLANDDEDGNINQTCEKWACAYPSCVLGSTEY